MNKSVDGSERLLVVWYETIRYDMVWYDATWYDTIL